MTASENNSRPSGTNDRLLSGIPRLDFILKGGLLRGATYTVLGPPGSGKTIFANQLCFNHVRGNGGNCVYVTLLSESVTKMLTHVSALEFYEAGVVGQRVHYVSGFHTLETEGLDGLLRLIQKTVVDHEATLLVLDGVETASEAGASADAVAPGDYRRFVHRFQAFTALQRCTTLILSAHAYDSNRCENTTTDGVLELSYQLVGPRAVRELTVYKFRGSDFLPGKHEAEITGRGMQIHPRTEVQFDKPPGIAKEARQRIPFGIASLDAMMEGGPLSGSATAMLGAPGTGKTMLGLTFLTEGARRGERGIYFGFYEPPPRLIEKASKIGLELEKYVKDGTVEILWQPPLEHYMDSLAEQLLEKVKVDQGHDRRRRLFVDGIEGFRAASIYPDRMPRFLSAFFNQLRMEDITTLISEELGIFEPELNLPSPELVNVVESVLLLRYVELDSELRRFLSIMKMRESKFDMSIREFHIHDDGIEVDRRIPGAEGILSGQARLRERGGHENDSHR